MRQILALGPFRLDTQSNLLLRGDQPIALGQRAIALLRALIEQPGAVVSRDRLIEAAWGGQPVGESNLGVQISALRRALSDETGGDRWIETLPRRGYRFVGPNVTEMQDAATAALPLVDGARDRAAMPHDDAERHQITVMSCELAGADGLGLEDLRDAAGAFHRLVAETADSHDGFVISRLGTTGIVLFGYPVAREHDAEQAVRAGLALCAAINILRTGVGAPARGRVGIATGAVVIGALTGGGAAPSRDMIGDAPPLAGLLRLSAPPDAVAIEPATRRLIGDLFECRELGTIDTTSDTGRVWRVLGESSVGSRFEALRPDSLTSLVGRDDEIDLLLRRWERAKAGDGQVVLISGEPGLGKSRIVAAFEERIQAGPRCGPRYFCSPYHQDSALYPFIDQLGREAKFTREDGPDARLGKLEALLARETPSDEDVALLADMMSLPAPKRHALPDLGPRRKKERTLEALIRHLEGRARQQPMVVVFEDAHWIDPTSRELLDLAVERFGDPRVLLIVTFRPEFQPPWTGRPQVSMITLNRLDRRERTTLVAQIAGGKALPDEVKAQIVERTDGVPLFVEELTKSVLESGLLREEGDRYVLDGPLPPFGIPTTLHGSLLARLGRLASVRRVAQIAAVIGRDFSYALLDTVSGLPEDDLRASLASLVASELVFQRGTPPDAFYSFKHSLVRDAAYGSLLRDARRPLHALVAEALEAHSGELMDSKPEIFAQHYAAAGLVEKSVACWSKAGRISVVRSAMAEAAAQFGNALAQLALLPDNRERQRQELELHRALGAVLMVVKGFAAPETGHAYARARELWERLGSPVEFLQVPYGQSHYHAVRGELALAQRLDEDLLRVARQQKDALGLVLGHACSGRNLMLVGGLAASRSHLEAVLPLYDPISHRSLVHQVGIHPNVISLAYLGDVLFLLGLPDQALARSQAAIDEARRLDHPASLALSLSIGAVLLSLVGDYAALDARACQLEAVATEQGFPFYGATSAQFRGLVKAKNGDVTEGIALLRIGSNAYRATGTELWMPFGVSLLAMACEISGRIDEASSLLDEALQIAKRTGECWFAAELLRRKGQLLWRQGQAKAAEEYYRKALGIAADQGAKLWELRAAASLARLRLDQGRRAEARDILAPIHGWFTEGFDTPDLKQATALLGELA
jgi:DNA-binding winged helix-turn-helix (wHTH) protein/predicted ATPase